MVVDVRRSQAVHRLPQDGVAVQEVGPGHVHRVPCLVTRDDLLRVENVFRLMFKVSRCKGAH